MRMRTMTQRQFLHRQGFSLVEVLVAIIILLIGVVATMRIFPRGFEIFARTQQSYTGMAQVESWINDFTQHPENLPDGIYPVEENETALSTFDFTDLRGVALPQSNINGLTGVNAWFAQHLYPYGTDMPWPLWQPASLRVLRKVVGERCVIPATISKAPIGDTNVAVNPNYLPRFSPMQADKAPVIYDLRYRRVGEQQLAYLLNNIDRLQDRLYYCIDYEANEITFLPDPADPSDNNRRVRLSIAYQQNGGEIETEFSTLTIPGGSSDLVTVTLPSVSGTFIPGSEQVNRAYQPYSIAATLDPTSSEFDTLSANEQQANVQTYYQLLAAMPSGYYYIERMTSSASKGHLLLGSVYFSRADAGRTVKLDYVVADWGILHDDLVVDEDGFMTLSLSPKVRNKNAGPHESTTWGLYSPMEKGQQSVVMGIVNRRTGVVSEVTVDDPAHPKAYRIPGYTLVPDKKNHRRWEVVPDNGSASLIDEPLRVYYRAVGDWSLQFFRPPAVFSALSTPVSVAVGADNAVTYDDVQGIGWNRFALGWTSANAPEFSTGWMAVPSVYGGQSIAVDYEYQRALCQATSNSSADSGASVFTVSNAARLRQGADIFVIESTGTRTRVTVSDVNTSAGSVTLSDTTPVTTGALLVAVDEPVRRVSGEVHSVPQASGHTCALFRLQHAPLPGTPVTVRGVSVTVRACWIQQRSGMLRTLKGGGETTQTVKQRWTAKQSTVVLPTSVE